MSVAVAPPMMQAQSQLPTGPSSLTVRHQARVRFYRRMRVQRVYRVTVEIKPADSKAASGSAYADVIIARPVIPGAVVQPIEQEIGAKASNNKISFSVTPLAKGRLKDARVQLLYKGRLLDEIKTSMRGTSQRKTWVLFFCTLVSLAFFLNLLPSLPNLSEFRVYGAIRDRLPDYDSYLPEGVRDYLKKETIAQGLQDGYDRLYNEPHLLFYITAAFLVLTVLFWLRNRPPLLKKTRKGKEIILPTAT
jgi:protein tyrosine phosphatase (PTP) superfamily phosphohydrolase (DUF442 family)